MEKPGELIFRGAEAEVRRSRFLGVPSVRKQRVAKTYRHPELDERIRRERTRAEAQLLAEAAAAGIPVPRLVDVDLAEAALELEAIAGDPLRLRLQPEDPESLKLCRAFGHVVGRLHAAGLVHGDLTTSNVLVRDGQPVLVDFGLAQRSADVEDRGVDLVLAERTFSATHPDHPEYVEAFRQGYQEGFPEAASVLRRALEIKRRARYV